MTITLKKTAQVTLSRENSGFNNVPDRWSIGSDYDEYRGGMTAIYELPGGFEIYEIVQGEVYEICNDSGYLVDIITHRSGRPQIVDCDGQRGPVLKLVKIIG